MYSNKNMVGLTSQNGISIYLDLVEGDLKKDKVPRKVSQVKIFLAIMLTLPIMRMNFFQVVLVNTSIKIGLFLISIIVAILLGMLVNKRGYQDLEVETVRFSRAEFKDFQESVRKNNQVLLILGFVLVGLFFICSCLYFVYPHIFPLFIVDFSVWSIYTLATNKMFTVKWHFEKYLDFDKVYVEDEIDV